MELRTAISSRHSETSRAGVVLRQLAWLSRAGSGTARAGNRLAQAKPVLGSAQSTAQSRLRANWAHRSPTRDLSHFHPLSLHCGCQSLLSQGEGKSEGTCTQHQPFINPKCRHLSDCTLHTLLLDYPFNQEIHSRPAPPTHLEAPTSLNSGAQVQRPLQSDSTLHHDPPRGPCSLLPPMPAH